MRARREEGKPSILIGFLWNLGVKKEEGELEKGRERREEEGRKRGKWEERRKEEGEKKKREGEEREVKGRKTDL